jgi:hypothetical protein
MRFALRSLFPGQRPRTEDTHADSLMASDAPPPAVQPLLRAIAADPRPHELGGFQEPLAHYRAAFPTSRPSVRRTWRTAMLSPLGASIAGIALALGGTAAAAYTGSLPTPAQNLAHTVIGAPAAHPAETTTGHPSSTEDRSSTGSPSAKGTPVGPDASGPDAFGLCTAWTQHQVNGASTNGKADDSVAFKNLATAAGGADKIAAYCATILQPGNTNSPGGKPSALPTQASTDHPTGKPSTLPT